MNHKNLFVGISVFVVLCVLATPVLGEKCKQVNMGQTKYGPLYFDPEHCGIYDGCGGAVVSGTFSGTLWESFFFADQVHVSDGHWTFTNYGVIETKQGELFFTERSVADFAAPDGFAVHMNVTGGTGRYEGATGWMAYSGNFEGTNIKWVGEVCWPDEE